MEETATLLDDGRACIRWSHPPDDIGTYANRGGICKTKLAAANQLLQRNLIPEPNFTEVCNDTQAKQLANSLQNVIFGENVRFLEGWHRPKSTIEDDEDVLDIRTYRCGIKKPPM